MTNITMNLDTGCFECDFITKDGLRARGELPINLEIYKAKTFPLSIRRVCYRPTASFEEPPDSFTQFSTRTYELYTYEPLTYREVSEKE